MRQFLASVRRLVYRARLRALRASAADKTPKQTFGDVGDVYWLWLHTEGFRESPRLRDILPGFPDAEVQLAATGAAGDATLRQGFTIYALFKRLFEKHHGRLGDAVSVLDFGCGWGRVIRFFLREVEPARLVGLDADAHFVEVCRQTNRWCRFVLGGVEPPAPLPAETFDLVYAYSIFSHLAEDVHLRWLAELHRLLKPGGVLIVTTRERAFLERVEHWRKHPEQLWNEDYAARLARCFPDTAQALAAHDRGEFCFAPLGLEGDWASYGEACIPEAYVRRRWSDLFTVLEYIDDASLCGQNVIVVRRSPDPVGRI